MDDVQKELSAFIQEMIGDSHRPGKKIALAEILKLWEKLHAKGVMAFDFAHAAVVISECVMTRYDSLEENIVFGEYLKECGAGKIRRVTTHWPPVKEEDWPADWPKGLIREE